MVSVTVFLNIMTFIRNFLGHEKLKICFNVETAKKCRIRSSCLNENRLCSFCNLPRFKSLTRHYIILSILLTKHWITQTLLFTVTIYYSFFKRQYYRPDLQVQVFSSHSFVITFGETPLT